jgi:prepilin-type N-terminal cleavage/methylation domain-containing protein
MIRRPVSHKNNVCHERLKDHGFTLFELVVVILLLCGIYYLVIGRLMYYRTQYEAAEVRWTLSAMRASKRAELAPLHGGLSSGEAQRQSNPMRLLSQPPHNYLGELCDPDVQQLRRGSWYFDRCNSWLVYVYNSEKIFAREHPKILKFNVESLRLLTDPARDP